MPAPEVPALGLYATREGLLGQATVLVTLVLTALWSALRRDRGSDGSPKRHAAAPAQ